MKIVQINATCGVGSTGKICVGISEILTQNGIENYILYSSKGNGYPLGIRCSDDKYIKLQALKSRILGNYGFNSSLATRKMIKELDRISPDIVHIHNIHGHDCNLKILFEYFKNKKTKLVWTFHDCWVFTGYCPHYAMVGCDKWKTECNNCPQRKEYSWFFDNSKKNFNIKKKLFEGLDLTVVTPSEWLAGEVKKSFLKDARVEVIRNGIDLEVFRQSVSDFKKRYGIESKKMLLGVAFDWGMRKGLDVFCTLAQRLDPEKYAIVLVGTSDAIDKTLPKNIISIHRTTDQKELAEIYTAADLFVNPTREENFPTVNIESIACGTPVLTFRTGGSMEMLDENSGSSVECEDIDSLEREIKHICEKEPYNKDDCIKKAKEFDKNIKFREYTDLYERINLK
jgi:glycosyltransferase involved in cell wall biosynthesis